jgi:hypothetical protein
MLADVNSDSFPVHRVTAEAAVLGKLIAFWPPACYRLRLPRSARVHAHLHAGGSKADNRQRGTLGTSYLLWSGIEYGVPRYVPDIVPPMACPPSFCGPHVCTPDNLLLQYPLALYFFA